MRKYELGDKLEVHSTPYIEGVESFDGEIVTVLAYPGCNPQYPESYGVLFSDGVFRGVHPRFLRRRPLAVPTDRGDIDVASNWEAFDMVTKIDSSKFRSAS